MFEVFEIIEKVDLFLIFVMIEFLLMVVDLLFIKRNLFVNYFELSYLVVDDLLCK